MPTSREVHLVRRPEGMPRPDDFALVQASVSDAGEGEVLVQNLLMSVDPAMRPRLDGPTALDEAMPASAIGRVEQSRSGDLAVGDIVQSSLGFREYATGLAKAFRKLAVAPDVPLTAYLNALGGTGFTAYGGLLDIASCKDGEQVFVSTAAGAVGQIAAQIAKIKGCRVIGSTGSAEKAAWLRDTIGLDVVIDYKAQPIGPALREATPEGLDVYFDNVGGDHLDAALSRMNTLGRIAVCGAITGYNGGGNPVTKLSNIIYRRVMLRGFVATDFMQLHGQFVADMTGWLRDGRIVAAETVYEGIERAGDALIGLMEGRNTGKMLVRLAE